MAADAAPTALPTAPARPGRRRGPTSLRASRRRALVAVGAAVVLQLLALAALSAGVVRAERADVVAWVEVVDALAAHEDAVLTREADLRGALLGGGPAAGDGSADALAAARERLRARLALDPVLGPRLLDVVLAEQAWAQSWEREGTPGARGVPAVSAQALGAYREAHERALSLATARRDAARRDRSRTLLALAALDVAVGLLAAAVFAHQGRRLVRDLDGPVRAVHGVLQRVHRGERVAELPATDVRELDDVAAALAALSGALHEERAGSARRREDAERTAGQLRAVLAAGRAMATCSSTQALAAQVVASSARVSGGSASLWTAADGAPGAFTCAAWSQPQAPRPDGDASIVAAVGADGRRRTGDGEVVLPLIGSGSVLGVLHVRLCADPSGAGEAEGADPGDVVDALEALTLAAAAHLGAVRLHELTRRQAVTDPLTGLANRHQLEQDLAAAWAEAAWQERPLSFAMLDVDHFKRVNDTAGHQVGDEWLTIVADVVTSQLRSSDGAYRFGGEEIALLLPDTGEEGAAVLLERIRAAVEDTVGPDAYPRITASLGVAERRSGMRSAADLVAAADKALYAAKRSGRNFVLRSALIAYQAPVGELSGDPSQVPSTPT
ncbi:diguanylate cyclase [Kineococcus sp. SYSU DK004]|uniref:diguanylate cyclase n=1 Tax=Kineococcus sp. SYSU DK004 TaxID=3383125 RepID=UPI003D7F1711